jgi:hypothetical protein
MCASDQVQSLVEAALEQRVLSAPGVPDANISHDISSENTLECLIFADFMNKLVRVNVESILLDQRSHRVLLQAMLAGIDRLLKHVARTIEQVLWMLELLGSYLLFAEDTSADKWLSVYQLQLWRTGL